MTDTDLLSPPSPAFDTRTGVIDCDVHPVVPNGLVDLKPFLTRAWYERFERKKGALDGGRPLRYLHPNGAIHREDARSETGAVAGSDPAFLVKDLIEAQGIEAVILNCLQAAALSAVLASVDESVALASAFNRYFIETWLPVDRRLRFAPVVPTQDPAAAALEIRRVADHPQVAAISLPLVNVLVGNRYYWPIFEAAQDVGLPIFIHVTGTESIYHGAPVIGPGVSDSYMERYLAASLVGEASVNSLVMSGALEKFPDLKFMFVEYGFVWLLPLLWRMDRTWRGIRHDAPWVKKSPIDYVHERISFTTQPIEEPRDPRHLEQFISMMGYDLLCFATDYPHWDNDMPGRTLNLLPEAERDRIFGDNARRVLRLS